MIATETMIGRSTTADAAITSTALICVRPVFGLTRRLDIALMWNAVVVISALPVPRLPGGQQAQISLR
jgi:hypothetical protein